MEQLLKMDQFVKNDELSLKKDEINSFCGKKHEEKKRILKAKNKVIIISTQMHSVIIQSVKTQHALWDFFFFFTIPEKK